MQFGCTVCNDLLASYRWAFLTEWYPSKKPTRFTTKALAPYRRPNDTSGCVSCNFMTAITYYPSRESSKSTVESLHWKVCKQNSFLGFLPCYPHKQCLLNTHYETRIVSREWAGSEYDTFFSRAGRPSNALRLCYRTAEATEKERAGKEPLYTDEEDRGGSLCGL